ncbi:hexapeptide repeat-containing transferase [Nostoc carneum NIES-2107]|nr:hexapeptide repeat-containing transferase [Nostoc carneum NIES-2107]
MRTKKYPNFSSFLFEEIKTLRQRYLFHKYRYQMQEGGIFIDKYAVISAIEGIEFGFGTRIYADATIAATYLDWHDSLNSTPNGSIRLGQGCVVHKGAILASYGGSIEIGDEVSVNPGTILYGHGGLRIGDNTRIAANTVIIPANHVFIDINKPIKDQGLTCKGISIGCDVWIGTGVTILDGVTVGDGAVMGAGCVVTKDVNPGEVVAGVPAKLIALRGQIIRR